MNDDKVESLLRQAPLAKPSVRMDLLVMGSRRKRVWPAAAICSALAAAAAVLVMVLLQGMFWTPARHGDNVAAGRPQILKVEPISEVVSKPKLSIIDGVERTVIEKSQTFRVTYVDEHNAVHQVTVGKPHTETIVVEGTVK